MVLTRNQKRTIDESSSDENGLHVADNFSNVQIKKKPKKEGAQVTDTEGTQVTDSNTEGTQVADATEVTEEVSEGSFQTETTTENESMHTSEFSDHESDEGDFPNEDGDEQSETKLQKILNFSLNQKQMQQIINQSIKNLVKQYNADGMEFDGNNDPEENEQEYNKFIDYIEDIYSGDFFRRIPVEERKKRFMSMFTQEQIKELNEQLENLQSMYKDSAPSVVDILKMNTQPVVKQKLLEKMHQFSNSEVLSHEYSNSLKYLNANIRSTDDILFQKEQEMLQYIKSDEFSDDYKKKILLSDMSFENKVIAYKKLQVMETYEDSDTSEYGKYKNWLDTLLSVPFGKAVPGPSFSPDTEAGIEESKVYMRNIRQVLDKRLSFLEKPKDQIINVVTQMIRNPNFSINAIGLYGGKGLGKCLARDTPVLMYNGDIKPVQDIGLGEILMGDDSTPRHVMSLAHGREEMYKIKHSDTNDTYTVNESHILSLQIYYDTKIFHDKEAKQFTFTFLDAKKLCYEQNMFRYDDDRSQVIAFRKVNNKLNEMTETPRVIDVCVRDYLVLPRNIKKCLFGYTTGVDFNEAHVQDGAPTQEDNEHFYNLGLNFYQSIPQQSFIASRKLRLQMLAGIIDAKGTVQNDGYNLFKCENYERITFLAKSLGYVVVEGTLDTLKICGKNLCDIPVRTHTEGRFAPAQTEGRFARVQSTESGFGRSIYNISSIEVESCGEGEYFGFEIDGNRRFVLGNFVVTHNTSIVKSIAEALGRPFRTISLGGESDASLLTGHGFTYVGSTPGRLIEILRDTKCMNPVVLIDELDKVSQTHHGKEIIGTLIHLTDSTTNKNYNYDRYFSGVDFDLSKVLFVFTYNDADKIDRILADRLFKIKVDNYSFDEKLEITKKHLVNDILQMYGFTNEQIRFEDEALNYIVGSNKADEGMRDIKRKFETIVSRINTLLLTDSNENIIRLKYKNLYEQYKSFPVVVKRDHIDVFLLDSNTNHTDISIPPAGMYT